MSYNIKIGNGYDVHRLIENRDLIIGGVKINYNKGLLGHSDADVLLHAIIDSLFGAASLPDIGSHFPDSEPKYKDISSITLLKETANIIKNNNYKIINIDTIIVAQSPKLSPYLPDMRVNISKALDINLDQINIKATTEEHLGFTGEEKGISAYSVALLEKL